MSLPIHPVAHSLAAGRGGVASLAGGARASRIEQSKKAAATREVIEREEKTAASDGPVAAAEQPDALSPDLPREEVADHVKLVHINVKA